MDYIKIERKYLLQVVWELQGATHMVDKHWSKTLSQGGVEERAKSQNSHSETVKSWHIRSFLCWKLRRVFVSPNCTAQVMLNIWPCMRRGSNTSKETQRHVGNYHYLPRQDLPAPFSHFGPVLVCMEILTEMEKVCRKSNQEIKMWFFF